MTKTEGADIAASLELADSDKRLIELLGSALGYRSAAMDDLAALLFAARSKQSPSYTSMQEMRDFIAAPGMPTGVLEIMLDYRCMGTNMVAIGYRWHITDSRPLLAGFRVEVIEPRRWDTEAAYRALKLSSLSTEVKEEHTRLEQAHLHRTQQAKEDAKRRGLRVLAPRHHSGTTNDDI